MTKTKIAKRFGVSRQTVYNHLNRWTDEPFPKPRPPRPWKLDPFKQYIQAWRGRFDLPATVPLREIEKHGYTGEIHPALVRLRLVELPGAEPERAGDDEVRHAVDGGVVVTDGPVVEPASALEVGLHVHEVVVESGEVLARLQVGVRLLQGDEPPQPPLWLPLRPVREEDSDRPEG